MRIRLLFMAAVLLGAGACGSSQPLEPLVVGSQQYFALEWQIGRRGNLPLVQGYITNKWGFTAANMRLLVEGLEPPDRVGSQRLIWLGGQLTPGTRAYFETSMPSSRSYRVRVFSYDWVQSPEMFSR